MMMGAVSPDARQTTIQFATRMEQDIIITVLPLRHALKMPTLDFARILPPGRGDQFKFFVFSPSITFILKFSERRIMELEARRTRRLACG